MKKLITLICALACILSLTACQTNESNDVTSSDVDASVISQYTETLFNQFQSMTPEEIEEIQNAKNSSIAEDVEVAIAIKRGLGAWNEVQEDLGAYVSTDGFDMVVAKDSVTGTLHLTFEKRTADFSVTYDDAISKYTNIKIEPAYTTGEKLKNAGLNTLMGMGIVFIVLIFIAFIISLFKYINKFEHYLANRKNKKDAAPAFEPKSPEGAPVVYDMPDSEDNTDPYELIAVITAAIAASENTTVDQLVVRSIRRRKNNR